MADSQMEDAGIDIDAASDRIGESLFGPSVAEETPEPETGEQVASTSEPTPSPATPVNQATPSQEPPVDLLPPPKSWRQDMHAHWAKMPKEAQAYYNEREQQMLNGMSQYKQIQSVLEPFVPQLSQRGITAYDWVRGLVNAERMLTQGSEEQRRAAYQKLGEQLGFTTVPPSQPSQVDPVVQQLQQKLSMIESGLTAQQQHIYNEAKSKVQQEVDAFAADTKAHPYFDEVAADDSPRGLSSYLRQGLSLQDAYDAAVWANPVTRAKEQAAALTAHEAKLKENARLSALPKKRAVGVNVRSTANGTAPTEPTGSMEDTIKTTLREIRARAS